MSTFYNVRKSLIQAFRILFAAMLFVVAIGTVCPDIARAENLPESTQINEFAQSDEARTQTLALMEAVQNDGSPEASTQIAIGYADKVHYLRYDDSGAITNTITDPQDYDWVAPVEVEGRLVGRITIWDNNGSLEVGNFSPDIEEACSMMMTAPLSSAMASPVRIIRWKTAESHLSTKLHALLSPSLYKWSRETSRSVRTRHLGLTIQPAVDLSASCLPTPQRARILP